MTEKIKSISFSRFAMNEAFGFLNDVSHQLLDTFSDLPSCAISFQSAQKAFDDALKAVDPAFSAADLTAADHDADLAWSGLNAYLKAMLAHPEDDVREATEKIYNVFSQYDNPTALAYATEYGIMERLVGELKKIPSSILDKANATAWVNALDTKCTNFLQMYSMRVQDKATKVTGAAKNARLNAIHSYAEMVNTMNALLIVAPTEELARFATHLNELIVAKQITLKSRKTRAANVSANACAVSAANINDNEGAIP